MSRHELIEVAPHLHLRMLADVYQRADEFDVIHSHVDVWTLPFAKRSATPSVLTHARSPRHALRPGDLARSTPTSRSCRSATASGPPSGTGASGGRPPSTTASTFARYANQERNAGEHLAFVGRISPEKGPTLAIEVARRTGRPLHIAAKVDPMDVDYFEREVEPLLGAGVSFVGEIDEQQKPGFFAGAAATLFPSDWPEPFGLVMIESLAAGTPVIALRRGAVPEVLVDGVTGFICDDVDEMVAAVGRLDEIDPARLPRLVPAGSAPT